MKKTKILVVSDQFFPSIGSAANLMTELCEYLALKEFDVFVLTSKPDRIPPDSLRELNKNIKIKRIYIPFQKSSLYLFRGFFTLLAPLIYFFKAMLFFKKFDYVFIYSPPLSLGLTGTIIKFFTGSKFIFNVQDLFPQSAIDLNILKNSFLIKLFRIIEKKIYFSADLITAHSQGNLNFILKSHPALIKKARIMHNWIDFKKTKSPLKKNFEINENKKNIIFAGILGPSQFQGLLSFIKEFKYLNADVYDLILLIEGSEVSRLKKYLDQNTFKNIRIYPFIPPEEYETLLSKVDIGLITLSEEVKTPVVPGKLLSYMKAKLPVILIADINNDSHALIRDSGCGFSSDHNNKNIKKLLLEIDKSNLKDIGKKGYQYAYKNFKMENIINNLFKL